MKVEDKIKWLGQILSSGGLADSVAETVAAREGKIRGAWLEIVAVINDWRTRAVGGFETAVFLWESVCLPSLLHGSGTWTEISTATEKKLNQIQYWFLSMVCQVGPGAPRASLLWDFHLLDMSFKVWEEKIRLILFIKGLCEKSLSRQVYEEQKLNNWPGLAKETANIFKDLGIEDVSFIDKKKYEYIKLFLAACH